MDRLVQKTIHLSIVLIFVGCASNYETGKEAYEEGNYKEARTLFERELEVHPHNQTVLKQLGMTYKKLDKYQNAKEVLEKEAELDSEKGRIYLQLARIEFELGNFDAANTQLRSALLAGNEKAAEVLSKEIEKREQADQTDGEQLSRLLVNRGLTTFLRDDAESALSDYDKALKLDPDYVRGYNEKGKIYLWRGNFEGAKEEFKKALSVRENARSHLELADLLSLEGKLDRALKHVDQVISLQPKASRAYLVRFRLHRAKGEEHLAYRDLKKFFSFSRAEVKDQERLSFLGLYTRNSIEQNHDVALKLCNKYLDNHPNSAMGFLFRGRIYLLQNKTRKANRDIRKAISLKHPDLEGYILEKKVDRYRKQVSEIVDTSPYVSFRKGMNAYRNEDLTRAIALFRETLNRDSGFAPAHEYLARIYDLRREEYRKAIQHYSSLIEIQRQHLTKEKVEDVHYKSRGLCYYQVGKYQKALKDFQSIPQTELDEFWLRKIGFAHVHLGQFERGVEKLEQSLHIRKTPDAHLGLAVASIEKEKLQQAQKHVDRAKQMVPEYPYVHRTQALIYHEKDQEQKRNKALMTYLNKQNPNLTGKELQEERKRVMEFLFEN